MIRGRAPILAILTLLNLLNYLDRMLVSAVGPEVQKGLSLSDAELGWVNSIFMIGYFVSSPVFGYFGDRVARPRLVAAGVLVWSLATALSGTAESFWGILVWRVLVGVGEASYATLAPTIIDDLSSPTTKNRLLAIFYAAMPIGSALGFVLGGQLAERFGWRVAFMIAGGPGVFLSVLALLLRDPERALRAAEGRASALGDLARLARMPVYRTLVLGLAAQTFALGGFVAWASPFLLRRACLDLSSATLYFGAITVVTGFVGTAIGGFLGDRGKRPGSTSRAIGICAVSSLGAAPLAAAALFMPGANGFLVLLGLCELVIFVSTSPTNAAILTSVPSSLRASAMALSIFGIHLLGDLISPPLIGSVAGAMGDSTAACSGGEGLRLGMLTLPVALLVSGALWAVAHRLARAEEDAQAGAAA